MANAIQELQIQNNSANKLLAENRPDWERKRHIQNKTDWELGREAEERVRNQLPPKTEGDKLWESGEYLKDPETETDIELEQRNLINRESMQKVMEILNTGVTTYKTLQQIPIQVIKGLLLKGLLGQEAMAGEQAQDQLKIGLPPSQTQGHGEGLGPGATMRIKQMLEQHNLDQEKKKSNKKLKIKK